MKYEPLFSSGGFYPFVVRCDVLCHKAAVQNAKEVLRDLIQQAACSFSNDRPLKVLDLACGGEPVSIAQVMSEFPTVSFSYTGVDVNADQIAMASDFVFSDNVIKQDLIENNAWDLNFLEGRFDFVFSGMNFHHAVPEELFELFTQLKNHLEDHGRVFSHDFYRPQQYSYLRRPAVNPLDQQENLILNAQALSKHKALFASIKSDPSANDWREAMLKAEMAYLEEHGATEAMLMQNREHILGHDFPVSASEMLQIANQAGFSGTVLQYHCKPHPMSDYFAFLEFSCSEK